MRFPVIPLFVLALPFLEIAGFVLVGREIGVLWTLALVIAAGMAGLAVLRIQGFGIMARVRSETDAGRDPGRELANGVMILFAGVLLLIPGFVTDIIGAAAVPAAGARLRLALPQAPRGRRRAAGFSGFRRARHAFARQDDRPRRRRIQPDARSRHALAQDRPRLIFAPRPAHGS